MANPTVTIEIKEIGSDKVIDALKGVQTEAAKLVAAKKRIKSASKEVRAESKEEAAGMNALGRQMSRVVSSNKLAVSSLGQVGAQMQSVAGNTKIASAGMRAIGSQMQRVVSSNKLGSASLAELGAKMQAITGRTKLADRSMKALGDRMAIMRSSSKLSDEQLRNMGLQMQAIAGTTRLAETEMKRIAAQMQRVASSSKLAASSQREMASGTRELSAQIEALTGVGLADIARQMKIVRLSSSGVSETVREQATSMERLNAEVENLTGAGLDKLARQMKIVKTSNKGAEISFSDLADKMESITGTTKAQVTQMKAFGITRKLQETSAKKTADAERQLAAESKIATRIADQQRIVLAKLSEQLKDLEQRLRQVSTAIKTPGRGGLIGDVSAQIRAISAASTQTPLSSTDLNRTQLDVVETLGKGNRAIQDWTKNLIGANKSTGAFGVLLQNLETNAVLALGPLSGIGARIRAIGVLARRGNVALILFSLGIAAAAAAAVAFVAAMIRVRKALEPVEGRLRAVTGSALLARLELERLQQLALRTGLSVDSLTDGFSRLAAAARGTSLEGEGIRRVFDSVAIAAAALRLSTEDTEGILRAFEQALTKGVLRAEEFNQQLGDRLPGAAVLASRAINKTKQEFQALLVQGEIITEEFLPKLAEEFEKVFSEEAARNVETLNGALSKLGTSFSIFFDVLESRIGIVERLTPLLNRFADALVEFADLIDTALAKTKRSLRLFESDIVKFELAGILQTEKDRVVKVFTDLRTELQSEFSVLQNEFIELDKKMTLGTTNTGLIELSDILSELGEKDVAIKSLTAALRQLNEFEIKPLAEVTGPDITKLTKAFEKFVRAADTESAKAGEIIAGNLFGVQFEASLLKAQDRLARFSNRVVVEFAISNKLISDSLADAFKQGDTTEKAEAFAEILEIVSDKFATVIQNAKDFKAIGKIFTATRKPLEEFNIEMRELVRLLDKNPGQIEAINRAMDALKDKLIENDDFLSILKTSFEDLGDTMVDVIKNGEGLFEGLINVLNKTLEAVLDLIIQLIIINPLLNAMDNGTRTTGLGGILDAATTLFGGGGGASTAGAASGAGVFDAATIADSGFSASFAHGGGFTVGGAGGIDDTLVKFRATRGERVEVTPAGEGSNERMWVVNFNFPPGTNVKEFGDAQNQIAAMLAGTLSSASASNS